MGKHNHAPLPNEFGEVRTRIQAWRAAKKPGSAMPCDLWKEAASWTAKFGIHRVCKALGLSQTRMNEYLEPRQQLGLRQVPKVVQPTFVELTGDRFMGSGMPQAGPVVEVTSPDGGRLVMRLAPGTPMDVIGLVQSFLGSRA